MKREKRAYSSFSNFFYIYKDLWMYDKSTIIFAILEVLLQVAAKFIIILLPAMVVNMLEIKLTVTNMALQVMVIFTLYGLLSAMATFLVRRNRMQYVEYRAGHVNRAISRKVMSIDYVQYEGDKNQKLIEKAINTLNGNDTGLEGILHLNVQAATGILVLILYTIVIANVHYLIIFMLLLISFFQYFC